MLMIRLSDMAPHRPITRSIALTQSLLCFTISHVTKAIWIRLLMENSEWKNLVSCAYMQFAGESGKRQSRLCSSVRELQDQGLPVLAMAGDVRDRAGMQRIVQDTVAQAGGLDIMVTNAGDMHSFSCRLIRYYTPELVLKVAKALSASSERATISAWLCQVSAMHLLISSSVRHVSCVLEWMK